MKKKNQNDALTKTEKWKEKKPTVTVLAIPQTGAESDGAYLF